MYDARDADGFTMTMSRKNQTHKPTSARTDKQEEREEYDKENMASFDLTRIEALGFMSMINLARSERVPGSNEQAFVVKSNREIAQAIVDNRRRMQETTTQPPPRKISRPNEPAGTVQRTPPFPPRKMSRKNQPAAASSLAAAASALVAAPLAVAAPLVVAAPLAAQQRRVPSYVDDAYLNEIEFFIHRRAYVSLNEIANGVSRVVVENRALDYGVPFDASTPTSRLLEQIFLRVRSGAKPRAAAVARGGESPRETVDRVLRECGEPPAVIAAVDELMASSVDPASVAAAAATIESGDDRPTVDATMVGEEEARSEQRLALASVVDESIERQLISVDRGREILAQALDAAATVDAERRASFGVTEAEETMAADDEIAAGEIFDIEPTTLTEEGAIARNVTSPPPLPAQSSLQTIGLKMAPRSLVVEGSDVFDVRRYVKSLREPISEIDDVARVERIIARAFGLD